MDFASVTAWFISQPWHAATPFLGVVLADWALGSFEAWRAGDFKKTKVFDWVQTTIGWQKAAPIVGSVVLAYFLKGQDSAYAALLPLVAVNGAAFLVVGHDVVEKLQALPVALFPKK